MFPKSSVRFSLGIVLLLLIFLVLLVIFLSTDMGFGGFDNLEHKAYSLENTAKCENMSNCENMTHSTMSTFDNMTDSTFENMTYSIFENMTYSTFDLKKNATSWPLGKYSYRDFTSYLYGCKPIRENEGKILIQTKPRGGRVIAPSFRNGFIGAIYKAYNEHRHLVLTPDDVWLAITTAFGLYVNNHAEEMRSKFVDHEGKIELTARSGGNLYTVDWGMMIDQMSDLIENKTKEDVRSWIEPNFSTTTPVIKTVGQIVLMGIMKEYFDYSFDLTCGIPKVTLEGTLEDWKELRRKASHLKTFKVDNLTDWAGLLDPILKQFEESYKGNVNVTFWSHISHREGWGSGPRYLNGWVNVFIPFSKTGEYKLYDAEPSKNHWNKIDFDDIPPSTTEVPVLINDNGRIYSTIFYGGHIVCVYNEADDTLRPSLDWAIVDVTEFLETQSKNGTQVSDELHWLHQRYYHEKWQTFPKPIVFNQTQPIP